MKIKGLLINRGWSDNLGDQAIKLTMEALFNTDSIELDFRDLIKNQNKSAMKYEIKTKKGKRSLIKHIFKPIINYEVIQKILWLFKNSNIKKFLKSNNYNFVIIGGGQLLHSNVLFPIALYAWVNYFKKFNKNAKVILFGVGAVSEYNLQNKLLLSKVFQSVDIVYVRDYESIQYLENNFQIKSYYCPDVVFCVSNFIEKKMLDHSEKTILYGITEFERFRKYDKGIFSNEIDYYEFCYEQLGKYIKEGFKVKLFYTTVHDKYEVEHFLNFVSSKYQQQYEVAKTYNVQELILEIQKSYMIVSARMHPLIIGLSYNKKVVPIEISQKLKSFKALYSSEKFNLREIQNQIANSVEEVKEYYLK